MTPPAGRRSSTAEDFGAFVVWDPVAFVCLAPELAFVCAAPPDVAAADPPADADVIVESFPVCEAGAWVFEACEVGGVVAVALPSDVAAKKATKSISN